MIPYVDLCIVLAAVSMLVRAARRPHPVHPATAILLTLLTGVLLWANLRPTVWQEEFGGVDSPPGLDPVTRAMFWRGWPLAPCMVCLICYLEFQPSGLEPCVLALDGLLFLVALYSTKAACDRLLRWRRCCNPWSLAGRGMPTITPRSRWASARPGGNPTTDTHNQ